MKIVGFKRSDFKPRESGEMITGYKVFFADEINPSAGKGVQVMEIYITTAKLDAWGIDLNKLLNADVKLNYNCYGKVAEIVVL